MVSNAFRYNSVCSVPPVAEQLIMANLYLTEQNSILRKSGDRLIVQKDDEILLEVQYNKIDAVLVFENVQFTARKQRDIAGFLVYKKHFKIVEQK